MRITVVAPTLTYPGVGHAGGELLLRHMRGLQSLGHSVQLLVPQSAWGGWVDSVPPGSDLPTRIVPAAPPRPGRLGRLGGLFRKVEVRLLPYRELRRFWRDVRRDGDTWEGVMASDAVELQWFETIVTAHDLRRLGFGGTVSGVYHDVLSQRLERELDDAAGPRSGLVRRIRLMAARHDERRAADELDFSLCLSEKDAALLPASGSSARKVRVVPPPLDDDAMPSTPPDVGSRPAVVLMVGDLTRAENDDAARWLLVEIWPRVVAAAGDDARLIIAGRGPSPALRDAVSTTPGAELTGYVESLAPLYQQARVAISPVRQGAGVKFKSIIPALWGLPVVSTTVGAEGIHPELFATVADDPRVLAAALVELLRDDDLANDGAARAFGRAHRIYHHSAHTEALRALYV